MSNAAEFFTNTDKEREAEFNDFVAHMKRPREKVEAAPDLEFNTDLEEGPAAETDGAPADDPDTINLDYTSEQLWSAELALLKFDEFVAWILSVWTGQSPKKYRRRQEAATKDDREVQLLAAIINKYQMRMSLEAAFLTIFLMGYSPVFMSAYSDVRKVKKQKKAAPKQEESTKGPIK